MINRENLWLCDEYYAIEIKRNTEIHFLAFFYYCQCGLGKPYLHVCMLMFFHLTGEYPPKTVYILIDIVYKLGTPTKHCT